MNLYEIDKSIMELIDFETGELINEEKWEELQLTRGQKIENIGLYIKNLTADAAALKIEEDAFAERRKTAENKAKRLKQYLTNYLDGNKFETAKVKLTFRKSEVLEVAEGVQVPEEYLNYKAPEINKTELKKAVKAGLVLDGVQIVEKQNLQVK